MCDINQTLSTTNTTHPHQRNISYTLYIDNNNPSSYDHYRKTCITFTEIQPKLLRTAPPTLLHPQQSHNTHLDVKILVMSATPTALVELPP